jgi:hypothetical protein
MVTADLVRSHQGHSVVLSLAAAGGGGSLRGRIVSCMESADGLVAYVTDKDGRTHTIHYQHIAELEALGADQA